MNTSMRLVDRIMNMTSYQDYRLMNVNRTIIRHVRTVNVSTMDLVPSQYDCSDQLWFRHQETSQWKMFLDSLSADYLFMYSISMCLGLLAGALFKKLL